LNKCGRKSLRLSFQKTF